MSANAFDTLAASDELPGAETNAGFQLHEEVVVVPSSVEGGGRLHQSSSGDLQEGRRRKEVEVLESSVDETSVTNTATREESIRKKFTLVEPVQEDAITLDSEVERSRCYTFFAKCRSREEHNWEPRYWPRICPHPYFPSYSQFARNASLCIVGLLVWGIVYSVIGKDAAPGGQLFNLAILSVAAHCGGWCVALTTLPALIGMLVVGILFQNIGLIHVEGDYLKFVGVLRKTSLVIILTRAGLDLDPEALKRLWLTVLKLGLVPWTLEAVVVGVLAHFLLDMPWAWGILLGCIVAAVSPAVVVPCLFRLRAKGYGVAKGIPTLIIAVAGIDDAASVAIFGIVSSIMFSADSLAFQIIQGPLSILLGVGFGICWGILAKFVPEKSDSFVVPMRVMMLLGGGLLAVFGSEKIGFEGAGPLGCITAAFVSSYVWSQQGWEIDEHPVAVAFEIFWMIFEPILFGITGSQVVFADLELRTFYLGFCVLAVGILARIALTVVVAIGSGLNLKEKVFVSLSWMAKATVQAALGPAALDHVLKMAVPNAGDKLHAETLLTVCILSILVTAPVGAILITLSGKRLLTRTTIDPRMEMHARPMRMPSIRHLSVGVQDEDAEHNA